MNFTEYHCNLDNSNKPSWSPSIYIVTATVLFAERIQKQTGRSERSGGTRASILPHTIARIRKLGLDQLHRGQTGSRHKLGFCKLGLLRDAGGSRGRESRLHRPRSPQWLLWQCHWHSALLCGRVRVPCLRQGRVAQESEGRLGFSQEIRGGRMGSA